MLRHYDKPKRNRTREQLLPGPEWKAANLISHVVWLEGAKIEIDEDQILVSQKWNVSILVFGLSKRTVQRRNRV